MKNWNISLNSERQRITQHKRFALRAQPNFCFAKTSFMLESLYAIPLTKKRWKYEDRLE